MSMNHQNVNAASAEAEPGSPGLASSMASSTSDIGAGNLHMHMSALSMQETTPRVSYPAMSQSTGSIIEHGARASANNAAHRNIFEIGGSNGDDIFNVGKDVEHGRHESIGDSSGGKGSDGSELLHAQFGAPAPTAASTVMGAYQYQPATLSYDGPSISGNRNAYSPMTPFNGNGNAYSPMTPFNGNRDSFERQGSPTRAFRAQNVGGRRVVTTYPRRNMEIPAYSRGRIQSTAFPARRPTGGDRDPQAIYPKKACIFVANLSEPKDDIALEAAITREFSKFGTVFVKIKRDNKNIPFGFCQYTVEEDAKRALKEGGGIPILGRECRVEPAKTTREWVVYRHNHGHVDVREIREMMRSCGNKLLACESLAANLCEKNGISSAVKVAFENQFIAKDDVSHIARQHPQFAIKLFDDTKGLVIPDRDEQYLSSYDAARRTLFVTRLPPGATDHEIGNFFAQIGDVVKVNTVQGYRGGSMYSFVEYARVEDANRAIPYFSNLPMRDHILSIEHKKDKAERKQPARVEKQARRIRSTVGLVHERPADVATPARHQGQTGAPEHVVSATPMVGGDSTVAFNTPGTSAMASRHMMASTPYGGNPIPGMGPQHMVPSTPYGGNPTPGMGPQYMVPSTPYAGNPTPGMAPQHMVASTPYGANPGPSYDTPGTSMMVSQNMVASTPNGGIETSSHDTPLQTPGTMTMTPQYTPATAPPVRRRPIIAINLSGTPNWDALHPDVTGHTSTSVGLSGLVTVPPSPDDIEFAIQENQPVVTVTTNPEGVPMITITPKGGPSDLEAWQVFQVGEEAYGSGDA